MKLQFSVMVIFIVVAMVFGTTGCGKQKEASATQTASVVVEPGSNGGVSVNNEVKANAQAISIEYCGG